MIFLYLFSFLLFVFIYFCKDGCLEQDAIFWTGQNGSIIPDLNTVFTELSSIIVFDSLVSVVPYWQNEQEVT